MARRAFSQGYSGYLHADAYTGYDGIYLGAEHEASSKLHVGPIRDSRFFKAVQK